MVNQEYEDSVVHRFPTFFEAGTPFIKMKGRSHPLVLKSVEITETVRFCSIFISKLLLVIHIDNIRVPTRY